MTRRTESTSMPRSDLQQKDKIQILLAEYAALREEIAERNGYIFQIGAVAAVSVTWLLQERKDTLGFWIGLAILLLGIAVFGWINIRDMYRAARRIKEIEHEVNSRAGEHLMVWETLWGGQRAGFLATVFTTVKERPRSELPPLDPSYLMTVAVGPQSPDR